MQQNEGPDSFFHHHSCRALEEHDGLAGTAAAPKSAADSTPSMQGSKVSESRTCTRPYPGSFEDMGLNPLLRLTK